MAQSLKVEIIGDASSYSKALGKATGQTDSFGSSLKGMGKAAAFAAGSAGVAGLTLAVHAGITEWMQQAKVTAQTEAVLKSTGGAAGITAQHVKNLATEVLNYSGIDDEAVQATENLILGFKNIRNEAGAGRDVFDRLTKVVIDYSVRTGKDARGAAILFGKSLQEISQGQIPKSIRGVGKLSTALQDEIEAHVKAGDVAGAQALLLGKLEKSYGGAAKAAGDTLPGQLSRLREQFNNLAAEGITVAIAKMEELRPAFETFIGVVQTLLPVLKPIAALMFDIFVTPMKVITDLIRGDWTAAWNDFLKPARDALEAVRAAFSLVADAIGGYVSDAITAATNFGAGILTGVTTGITGLATTIGTEITAGITAISDMFESATTTATTFGGNILSGMKAGILGFSGWVAGRVTDAIQAIIDALGNALTQATAFGANILSGMKAGILGFANWVGGRVDEAIQFLIDKAGAALTQATAFGKAIYDGVKAGIKGVLAIVTGPIQSVIDWLTDHAGAALTAATALGSAIYNGIKAGLGPIISFINGIKSALDSISGFFTGGSNPFDWVHRAGGGPVRRNAPYMVGERGPELFVPGANGRIVSNSGLSAMGGWSGGGGASVVNVYVAGSLIHERELEDVVARAAQSWSKRNGPLLSRTAGASI